MYRIIGADGNEYGPVTSQQILQWISEGRANANTKAQAEGTTEWKCLNEFPEFAAALKAKGSPPLIAGPAPAPGSAPVNPDTLAEEIIARGVDFSIGECFSRGWDLVKSDFWPIVGVSALMVVILWAVNGIYLGILANGPLVGGLYYYMLKRIRGQGAVLGDAFAGFSLAFAQLLLASLVSTLLSLVGFFLCIIPFIYLTIAWTFTFALVIDKRLEFWPAMEVSRKVINKVWWSVLLLVIVNAIINCVGGLLCCIGFFVTFPVTMAAMAYAYESIFNRPKQPAT